MPMIMTDTTAHVTIAMRNTKTNTIWIGNIESYKFGKKDQR